MKIWKPLLPPLLPNAIFISPGDLAHCRRCKNQIKKLGFKPNCLVVSRNSDYFAFSRANEWCFVTAESVERGFRERKEWSQRMLLIFSNPVTSPSEASLLAPQYPAGCCSQAFHDIGKNLASHKGLSWRILTPAANLAFCLSSSWKKSMVCRHKNCLRWLQQLFRIAGAASRNCYLTMATYYEHFRRFCLLYYWDMTAENVGVLYTKSCCFDDICCAFILTSKFSEKKARLTIDFQIWIPAPIVSDTKFKN